MSKRMGFAKKKEDIEKVIEEAERRHGHEEGHHHHHDVDDAIVALQTLIDALNTRTSGLEYKVTSQGLEIAKIYKILSLIVEAMAAKDEEAKRKAILEALKELEEER